MTRVLVVDGDSADAIMIREAMLEIEPDIAVDVVQDAEAGLWHVLAKDTCRPDMAHCSPDLVIVGVNEAGPEGCAFVRHLRDCQDSIRVPVVVLSAADCDPKAKASCTEWALSCLPKPTCYEDYKAVLSEVLDSVRGETIS